eukprot:TRINITY_DN26522_c0_g1_i3.p2 TRINITY_DN26522_c0_g1~~TRINITY_DN26522_c0_g1_i3.p2  ORF type:complete len:178 (-),score=44.20 TRINITY_DN26522_c0_g1_i3:482-1015(-)
MLESRGMPGQRLGAINNQPILGFGTGSEFHWTIRQVSATHKTYELRCQGQLLGLSQDGKSLAMSPHPDSTTTWRMSYLDGTYEVRNFETLCKLQAWQGQLNCGTLEIGARVEFELVNLDPFGTGTILVEDALVHAAKVAALRQQQLDRTHKAATQLEGSSRGFVETSRRVAEKRTPA